MFNLNEFINNWVKFKYVKLDGVELLIASLTPSIVKGVKALETHEDMFNMVADYGIAYENVMGEKIRIADDEEVTEKLLPNLCFEDDEDAEFETIWDKDELTQEVKEHIVDAICELSGIESILSDKKDEEESNVINGDDLPDGTTTLGELNENKQAVHNAIR